MAFPPYKRDQIDRNTCSSQPYAHNDMPPGESGIPPNNINEIVLSAIDIEMEMEVIMYPVLLLLLNHPLYLYTCFFLGHLSCL